MEYRKSRPHRPQVSPLCLGTMNVRRNGATPINQESIRLSTGARRRDQLSSTTSNNYSAGESEENRRQRLSRAGANEVVLRQGLGEWSRPQPARAVAEGDRGAGGRQLEAPHDVIDLYQITARSRLPIEETSPP